MSRPKTLLRGYSYKSLRLTFDEVYVILRDVLVIVAPNVNYLAWPFRNMYSVRQKTLIGTLAIHTEFFAL